MQTIKPAKQRKMVFQAPSHIRYKLCSAPLSAELTKSHGANALPIRSGDTVRIMRGDHKGFEGKISRVNRRAYRVYVEGLTREKVDGSTIFVPVHPSKVMITRLNLDDKWRKGILQRKKAVSKKVEEIVEKPRKRVAAVKEEIATEEKPLEEEKKPPRRKRKVTKKPAAKKVKEKVETAEKEKKPKAKKTRTKRKSAEKTEEGM